MSCVNVTDWLQKVLFSKDVQCYQRCGVCDPGLDYLTYENSSLTFLSSWFMSFKAYSISFSVLTA